MKTENLGPNTSNHNQLASHVPNASFAFIFGDARPSVSSSEEPLAGWMARFDSKQITCHVSVRQQMIWSPRVLESTFFRLCYSNKYIPLQALLRWGLQNARRQSRRVGQRRSAWRWLRPQSWQAVSSTATTRTPENGNVIFYSCGCIRGAHRTPLSPDHRIIVMGSLERN